MKNRLFGLIHSVLGFLLFPCGRVFIRIRTMAIKKIVKKTFDGKKEANIRGLISDIEALGVQVRREELKRGLGFRVMSGRCRAFDKAMIFLDRRLSQDEQIDFLKTQAAALGEGRVQQPDSSDMAQAVAGSAKG